MPKKKKYLSHVKITTVFPQTPPGDAGVEWEFSDVFMRLKIFVRSSTLKKNKNKKLNTAPVPGRVLISAAALLAQPLVSGFSATSL